MHTTWRGAKENFKIEPGGRAAPGRRIVPVVRDVTIHIHFAPNP
jgi:hypothetical protein